MKAAIYSRKSKYTGKGESIENQIQLCKKYGMEYLKMREEDFVIYEDEGFSGGNTNRPEFQKMLRDAKNKKFSMIICYRLDRISRNVSDFSNLIKDLNKYSVDFISIREQFDTTTPMGRAMMYIASVFSQLERETIAERIRDNMIELSKTGRWLGGVPPTGFKSVVLSSVDANGKGKKMFKLSPIEEEINVIKIIYNKYVELKSITKLEKYMIMKKINTKNGIDFKRYSLRFILGNPVYAIADINIYNYLISKGYEIYSKPYEFNGINGLMGYNKTYQNKEQNMNRFREPNEWIISVGKHKGVIQSDIWIEAQTLLIQNKSKSYRKVKSTQALLSGILKCSNCGSFMRPKAMQRQNKNGEKVFYYICEMKEKSKKSRCNISNINGNKLDKAVVSELKKFASLYLPLLDKIDDRKTLIEISNDSLESEINLLKKKLMEIDLSIMNLLNSIEKGQSDDILSVLYNRMEELLFEKKEINLKLQEIDKADKIGELDEINLELLIKNLSNISNLPWELMNVETRRSMIRSVVEKALWNGEEIDVLLFGNKMIEIK